MGICVTVAAMEESWPKDQDHVSFLTAAVDHFSTYATLTVVGSVTPQDGERKFIVENLSWAFICLESVWKVVKAAWLKHQVKISWHETYRWLSRVVDETLSVMTYQLSNRTSTFTSKNQARHDMVLSGIGLTTNLLLVEIFSRPTTPQDHQHPAEDAIKLELKAERVQGSGLLPYAWLPASICRPVVFSPCKVWKPTSLQSHDLTAGSLESGSSVRPCTDCVPSHKMSSYH
ncbi:hypothetical protein BC832DRAFT_361425 [Gaertneriomyces semiglobifer]|nr:hypothetical protein BC832DRAFT_361425 [Gaertneriomyces semiglobifer]